MSFSGTQHLILNLAIPVVAAALSTVATWTGDKELQHRDNLRDSAMLEKTNELQSAFMNALNAHRGLILKIVRMCCNNRLEEKDTYQEIVYQLWKSFPSFKGKSKTSTWMYEVAMRTAMMPFRRQRVELEFMESPPDISVGREVELNEIPEKFAPFLHGLDRIDRGIVALLLEGYTRMEIISMAAITESVFDHRMANLRKSMTQITTI